MPLQIIKSKGGRVRMEFREEPCLRAKAARHDRLMDGLRALAEMAEENPKLKNDPQWRQASNGIAAILKGKQ